MIKSLTAALMLMGAMMMAHAEVNMSPNTPPHEQPRAIPPSAEVAETTRSHYTTYHTTPRAQHHRTTMTKTHASSKKAHRSHHKVKSSAAKRACGHYKHRNTKTGKCVWNANHPHWVHHR